MGIFNFLFGNNEALTKKQYHKKNNTSTYNRVDNKKSYIEHEEIMKYLKPNLKDNRIYASIFGSENASNVEKLKKQNELLKCKNPIDEKDIFGDTIVLLRHEGGSNIFIFGCKYTKDANYFMLETSGHIETSYGKMIGYEYGTNKNPGYDEEGGTPIFEYLGSRMVDYKSEVKFFSSYEDMISYILLYVIQDSYNLRSSIKFYALSEKEKFDKVLSH